MRYLKLPAENLESFIGNLSTLGTVYGPVKLGEFYSFQELKNSKDIDLNYSRTMIPPKKMFLKLKEKMFEYDERKGDYKETFEKEKKVIFGVHPCDIHAMKLMDRIYLDNSPDIYYQMRRENAIIIGSDCHPDEYCFCQSTGTDFVTEGFDLFLHGLEGRFFVRIGSEKGNEIAVRCSKLFKEIDKNDLSEFREAERERSKEFTLKLDVRNLTDMLSLSYEEDVWKEYSDKCFGCGSCNLVCPTCRCYDVIDNVDLSLKSGERQRMLDSCMLGKHGLVYGKNFRPTRVERLRNRFNCKSSYREGMTNCVGCGRCTVYCPSKIDYVEVLRKVRGEL